MQVALLEDASDSSAPLTNININSPDEINGHFGTISYKKGASVITMMENFLGASTFRKGLQYYLDSRFKTNEFIDNSDILLTNVFFTIYRKYKITEPKYLFEGLQKAADEDKVLENYKNITVQGVMESWTSQNGYPLITVNVNMSTGDVTITQVVISEIKITCIEIKVYNFCRKNSKKQDLLHVTSHIKFL